MPRPFFPRLIEVPAHGHSREGGHAKIVCGVHSPITKKARSATRAFYFLTKFSHEVRRQYLRTTDSFPPHLTPRGGRKDLALQDEAPRLRLASMHCLLLGPVRVRRSLLRLPQGDPLGRQRLGPRLLAGPKDHRLRGGGVPGNQDQLLRLLLHEKLWYGAHVTSHFKNSCFQDKKMKLTCSRLSVQYFLSAGCFVFSLEGEVCQMFTYAKEVANASVRTKTKSHAHNFFLKLKIKPPQVTEDKSYYTSIKGEVLLFRQDSVAANALFPTFAGDWALHKDDPAAPNYSAMDELQDYVASDGIYHFKRVCFPEPECANTFFNIYCLVVTGCATPGSCPTTASCLTKPAIQGGRSVAGIFSWGTTSVVFSEF